MDQKLFKIGFFALLYFIQGAVFAYVVNFQKPYLASVGVSKDALGLFTSLLMIPFMLKVVLGVLSDRVPLRRFGPRKPYMIFGLCIFAICYALASRVDPGGSFLRFAILSWIASLGLAWFDTCADGWAVDIAREHEEGAIQAAMVAGRSSGLIVMSLVFGGIAERLGYQMIFLVLAGLSLIVTFVVLISPYQPVHTKKREAAHGLGLWLTHRYLIFALFGVLYSISSFGTDGLLTLHLSDIHGASASDLGVFGTFRGLGALLGAALAAFAAARWPLQKVLTGALMVLGGGCLLPLLQLPLVPTAGLWGVAWGLQETAFVTLAMVFSRGPWAATFFAVAMIFSNVGTSLGEAVAASSAGRFGYDVVFIGFSILAWLTILIVPRLERKN